MSPRRGTHIAEGTDTTDEFQHIQTGRSGRSLGLRIWTVQPGASAPDSKDTIPLLAVLDMLDTGGILLSLRGLG